MAIFQLPRPDYDSYLLDSQDYWAGQRGSTSPPAPSFRPVKNWRGQEKQRLGRYMDPFGCQGLMENQKFSWAKWYSGFLTSAGGSIVLAGVCLLALPILAVWYLAVRWQYRRRYDFYWSVLQEIERTGQPMWVPYDKYRLKLIDVRPNAVWP
jgi:hypothetical protein